ncbi:MAG: hypothetical protein DRN81_06210, partial [Thermoproteota archaeon]
MTKITYHSDVPQIGSSVESEALRENFKVLQQASSLWAREQDTPNLTVYISAGSYQISDTIIDYSGGNSPVIDVTSGGSAGQQRIAVLTIDSSSSFTWTYGAWVASNPSRPPFPDDEIPICEVLVTYNMSAITDSIITDLRPAICLSGTASAVSNLQGAYNKGNTIDISNDTPVILNKSSTNTAPLLRINNSSAGTGIYVNNTGTGVGIHVDLGATTGIHIDGSGITSGYPLLQLTSSNNISRGDIAFGNNRSNDPSSPAEGDLWYNRTAGTYKYYDGSSIQTLGGGGGASDLQSAYDGGNTIETDGTNPVIIKESSTASSNNILEVKNSGSGHAIVITTSGTGHDIHGTSGNWYVDKNGNATFNNVTANGSSIALTVNQTSADTGLKINQSGAGNALFIDKTHTGSDHAAKIQSVGSGYGLHVDYSGSNVALWVNSNAASSYAQTIQGSYGGL